MENQGIAYKAMEYMSNMKGVIKGAAVTGLAGLVLAIGASGCARTSGGSLTLGKLEWGDKVAMTRDQEVQKKVIESDAKYEDTTNATPGKGFGFTYDK